MEIPFGGVIDRPLLSSKHNMLGNGEPPATLKKTRPNNKSTYKLQVLAIRKGLMSDANRPKIERIGVRASAPVKQLLPDAARASYKNVSEFLLTADGTVAAKIVTDLSHFGLNEAQWQAFQTALDRPVIVKPRLKKLLSDPVVHDFRPAAEVSAEETGI